MFQLSGIQNLHSLAIIIQRRLIRKCQEKREENSCKQKKEEAREEQTRFTVKSWHDFHFCKYTPPTTSGQVDHLTMTRITRATRETLSKDDLIQDRTPKELTVVVEKLKIKPMKSRSQVIPKKRAVKTEVAKITEVKDVLKEIESRNEEEILEPEASKKRGRGRPRKDSLSPTTTRAKPKIPLKSCFKKKRTQGIESVKKLRFESGLKADVSEALMELVDIVVSDDSRYPVTPYPGKTPGNERIPRPPNAFMIFGKENRKRFAQKNPGLSNKDISILLGEKWKKLSDEVKKPYRDQARKSLDQHKKDYPYYSYCPNDARKKKVAKVGGRISFSTPVKPSQCRCSCGASLVAESDAAKETAAVEVEETPVTKKFREDNKENMNPTRDILTNQASVEIPEPRAPLRVITDLFVAPPGYENMDINGLEKFVLLDKKLIPYREWLQAEGDVKRLSGKTYTDVPENLLKPISDSVVAAGSTSYKNIPGENASTSALMNTAFCQDMTLNEYNGMPSSEGEKINSSWKHNPFNDSGSKAGSEIDARSLLQDLMDGGQGSTVRLYADTTAPVVVRQQPQVDCMSKDYQQLFWQRNNDL